MKPDNIPRLYKLYTLKCEENKYYIGVTSKSVFERFLEHQNGIRSAKWTLKYKPVAIIDQKELGVMTYGEAEKYENKLVKEYVAKFGINNVRGGNLRDTEDLIVRFGYVFDKSSWMVIKSSICLMIIIFILVVMYYLK